MHVFKQLQINLYSKFLIKKTKLNLVCQKIINLRERPQECSIDRETHGNGGERQSNQKSEGSTMAILLIIIVMRMAMMTITMSMTIIMTSFISRHTVLPLSPL
jgi:hypothetical protein